MIIADIIRTIVSRFLLLLVMVLAVIPVGILICLPRAVRFRCKPLFWCINFFYKAALWCTMMPITIIGKENIPTDPAIFVANHQSSLDIPLIGSLINGHPHVWLARSELMDTTKLLRIVLPRVAEVINVNSPTKAMRSLLSVIRLLQDTKLHCILFPEGQRFIDGQVHEFFGGFVILAKKTERPIIPVYITGVNKIYPPGKFLVHWYPITVVVGPAFIFDENETDEHFKQKVYDWFLQQAQQTTIK